MSVFNCLPIFVPITLASTVSNRVSSRLMYFQDHYVQANDSHCLSAVLFGLLLMWGFLGSMMPAKLDLSMDYCRASFENLQEPSPKHSKLNLMYMK